MSTLDAAAADENNITDKAPPAAYPTFDALAHVRFELQLVNMEL
jgi:hypothetical protein